MNLNRDKTDWSFKEVIEKFTEQQLLIGIRSLHLSTIYNAVQHVEAFLFVDERVWKIQEVTAADVEDQSDETFNKIHFLLCYLE